MDEAKTLIQMALSVIFSAMLIAACVGLISLGYMLWGSFSRESQAKDRLNTYANLSAYDNTVVRGQEVIQLIESNSDIFVVVLNGTYTAGQAASINKMSVASQTPYIYCPDEVAGAYVLNNIKPNDTSNVTLQNALIFLDKADNSTQTLWDIYETLDDIHKLYVNEDHQKLMNKFLYSETLGLPVASGSADADSFAAFKSGLIYAEDGTTDIVGVVFVRQDIGGDLGVD